MYGIGFHMGMMFLLCMLAKSKIASVRYVFSPDWRVTISSKSLTTVRISNTDVASIASVESHYFILNNGSQDIVSPNGNFAVGMLCISPNISDGCAQVNVHLMMQNMIEKGIASVVPLWEFQMPRQLCLNNEVNYADINMNSVEMYDNGTIVFSTDTFIDLDAIFLLPNSQLEPGMSLRASAGFFLEVTAGGLILRKDDMVYYMLGVGGDSLKEDVVQKSQCKGYRAVLHYNGTDLYLKYDPIKPFANISCDISPFWIWKSKSQNLSLPFLRLEDDGNLVAYSYNEKLANWVDEFKMIPADSGSASSFCITPLCEFGDVCDAKKSQCEKFIQWDSTLNGIGFYYLRYLVPNRSGDFDTCKNVCNNDLLCLGLFHNNYTRECFVYNDFVVSDIILLKDDTTVNITAFLKLPFFDDTDTGMILHILAMTASLTPMLLYPAAICCLVIVKKKKRKSFPEKEIELMLATMPGLPQRYTYTALDTATKGFSTKLGAGGFGAVYEGITADGKHVAVKRLKDCTDTAGSRQFVTELAGTGGISHMNIVKLCGFCIEGATQRLLIYEFMPNGSLDRWLFGSERPLTWKQRVSIALGAARGLAYLHEECSEPILHLDVKPQNILLDDNFVVKLADFGMAKLLENRDVSQVETRVRGTPGYMAPEWFLRNVATKKCDVYSYGMVLLELIGGRRNVDITKVNDEEVDPSWYFPAWAVSEIKQGNILVIVDEKVRVSSDNEVYEEMVKMIYVALWCIQDNPSARPSMHAIVEMLEGHADVGEPPYSFHFDVHTDAIVNSKTRKLALQSPSTLEIFEEDESSLLR